jgi:hypothetical protein
MFWRVGLFALPLTGANTLTAYQVFREKKTASYSTSERTNGFMSGIRAKKHPRSDREPYVEGRKGNKGVRENTCECQRQQPQGDVNQSFNQACGDHLFAASSPPEEIMPANDGYC